MRLLQSVLDFLFPPRCLVCGVSTEDSPGTYSERSLCLDCRPLPHALKCADHYTHCPRCMSPAHPVPGGFVCALCPFLPEQLGKIRWLSSYEGRMEAALKSFKYGLKRPLAAYFGEHMSRMITEGLFGSEPTNGHWDLIVPIPSSPDAVSRRGFNPISLIACSMSKSLNISSGLTVLLPQRHREAQAGLPLNKRKKNMQGAFRVHSQRVKGKRVLLIDDVLTTGATVFSASAALFEAEVRSVDSLLIARSDRFVSSVIEGHF